MGLTYTYFKIEPNNKSEKIVLIFFFIVVIVLAMMMLAIGLRKGYSFETGLVVLSVCVIGALASAVLLRYSERICIRSDGVVYSPAFGIPFLEDVSNKKGMNRVVDGGTFEFTQSLVTFDVSNIQSINVKKSNHIKIEFKKPLEHKAFGKYVSPVKTKWFVLRDSKSFVVVIKKLNKK